MISITIRPAAATKATIPQRKMRNVSPVMGDVPKIRPAPAACSSFMVTAAEDASLFFAVWLFFDESFSGGFSCVVEERRRDVEDDVEESSFCPESALSDDPEFVGEAIGVEEEVEPGDCGAGKIAEESEGFDRSADGDAEEVVGASADAVASEDAGFSDDAPVCDDVGFSDEAPVCEDVDFSDDVDASEAVDVSDISLLSFSIATFTVKRSSFIGNVLSTVAHHCALFCKSGSLANPVQIGLYEKSGRFTLMVYVPFLAVFGTENESL